MVTKVFMETILAKFWWASYFDIKIDVNMCEHHYVNLFLCDRPTEFNEDHGLWSRK